MLAAGTEFCVTVSCAASLAAAPNVFLHHDIEECAAVGELDIRARVARPGRARDRSVRCGAIRYEEGRASCGTDAEGRRLPNADCAGSRGCSSMAGGSAAVYRMRPSVAGAAREVVQRAVGPDLEVHGSGDAGREIADGPPSPGSIAGSSPRRNRRKSTGPGTVSETRRIRRMHRR